MEKYSLYKVAYKVPAGYHFYVYIAAESFVDALDKVEKYLDERYRLSKSSSKSTIETVELQKQSVYV